jgi:hypothetical protein
MVAMGLACLVAATPTLSVGDDQAATMEHRVKAVFLFKFFSFVEWPLEALPASSDSVVIGVLGSSPLLAPLQSLQGQETSGRQLVVRTFASLAEMESCHILYVSPALVDELPADPHSLLRPGILTVGEERDFLHRGGIVAFFVEEERVRFEINLEAARKANLKISSQLLSLARIHKPEES